MQEAQKDNRWYMHEAGEGWKFWGSLGLQARFKQGPNKVQTRCRCYLMSRGPHKAASQRPITEVIEQAIHWRTVLLILVRSVEWGNACHYPLKGHKQGKEMMKRKGQVYLAWGTHCTGLQGKDPRELDWSSLAATLAFIYYYSVCTCVYQIFDQR